MWLKIKASGPALERRKHDERLTANDSLDCDRVTDRYCDRDRVDQIEGDQHGRRGVDHCGIPFASRTLKEG